MNQEGSSVLDDSSAASRQSFAAFQSTSEESLNSSDESFLDYFFPLYDEMTRFCAPHNVLALLKMIVHVIQLIMTSFFLYMGELWDKDTRIFKIIKVFSYIADFGCNEPKILSAGALISVIIVLEFLIFLWCIYLLLYYRHNKSFLRVYIYTTDVVFLYLLPMLVIPSANLAGACFIGCWRYDMGGFIASTIFLVFGTIFISFIAGYTLVLRYASPFISNIVGFAWDGTQIVSLVIITAITAFFSHFLTALDTWTGYILILAYELFLVYDIIQMFTFPFIRPFHNVGITSLMTLLVINAIISTFKIPDILRINTGLLLVIIVPIYYFIFRHIQKKIIDHPSIKKDWQILRSIRIHIAGRPKDFINWKLIKAIPITSPTKIIVRIARVLSMFPSESHLLNFYISILSKRVDFTFTERFMLMQIRRIYILRQCSISKKENQDYLNLHQHIEEMVALACSFIKSTVKTKMLNIDTILWYSKLNHQTLTMCKEIIEKYPNSTKIANDYSKYLIECRTDFKEGVKMRQTALMIEYGKSNIVDLSYRNMVNVFPQYITQRILDYKGTNLATRRRERNGSTSNNLAMTEDLDIENNDEVAKQVISQPRLRMALKKTVSTVRPRSQRIIHSVTIFRFIITVLCLIAPVVVVFVFYDMRKENYQLIKYSSDVLWLVDNSLLLLFRMIAEKMNLFASYDEIERVLNTQICKPIAPQDIQESIIEQNELSGMTFKAIEAFRFHVASSIDAPSADFQKVTYMKKLNLCSKNGTVMGGTNMIAAQFIPDFMISILNITRLNNSLDDILYSSSTCEIVSNTNIIVTDMHEKMSTFLDYEKNRSAKYQRIIQLVLYIQPVLYFILLCFPQFYGYGLFLKEANYFFKIVMMLPDQILDEISNPIAHTESITDKVTPPSIKADWTARILYPIVSFLHILIVEIGVVLLLVEMKRYDNAFIQLNGFYNITSHVNPYLEESLISAFYAIIFEKINVSYADNLEYLNIFKKNVENLQNLHYLNILLLKNGSIDEFTKNLRAVQFGTEGNVVNQFKSFHDEYISLSLDQKLSTYITLANNVINYFENKVSDVAKTKEFIHMNHLALKHISPENLKFDEMVQDKIEDVVNGARNTLIMIACITFVIKVLVLLLERLFFTQILNCYNNAQFLISRLNPTTVASNRLLMGLVKGEYSKKDNFKMTRENAVYHFSKNPIMIITPTLTIVGMNPVASMIFGFTNEQIIGGSINMCFFDTSVKDISNRIVKYDGNFETFDVKAIKDDQQTLNLQLTLQFVPEEDLFILIMKDNTNLHALLEGMEDAKNQNEYLLYQLIPAPLIQEFQKKDEYPAFTVNSASILVFIIDTSDILLPVFSYDTILKNLSSVYSEFDNNLENFPLIHKLKNFRFTYMCCGGLFDSENLQDATKELVDYSINCVQTLEGICQNMEYNTLVRSGIITGGPISAGFIGEEKMDFEILTDITNLFPHILNDQPYSSLTIIEDTYELVNQMNYSFEECGVIETKHGNRKLYHVSNIEI